MVVESMKISPGVKAEYAKSQSFFKGKVQELLQKEEAFYEKASDEEAKNPYRQIESAEKMIYGASLFIELNSLCADLLEMRDNDALNEARKLIYKVLIHLETVLTNYVDVPYSDLDENMKALSKMDLNSRFYLIRKLGLIIDLLESALGEDSKWKLSFVEIRGRFAAVAKNFIDMRNAYKDYFDPSSAAYEVTVRYIRLVNRLLEDSANEYRNKYELSSRRIDDMRNAIFFLLAKQRLLATMGDAAGAEELKKKAVAWKTKLENDSKEGNAH